MDALHDEERQQDVLSDVKKTIQPAAVRLPAGVVECLIIRAGYTSNLVVIDLVNFTGLLKKYVPDVVRAFENADSTHRIMAKAIAIKREDSEAMFKAEIEHLSAPDALIKLEREPAEGGASSPAPGGARKSTKSTSSKAKSAEEEAEQQSKIAAQEKKLAAAIASHERKLRNFDCEEEQNDLKKAQGVGGYASFADFAASQYGLVSGLAASALDGLLDYSTRTHLMRLVSALMDADERPDKDTVFFTLWGCIEQLLPPKDMTYFSKHLARISSLRSVTGTDVLIKNATKIGQEWNRIKDAPPEAVTLHLLLKGLPENDGRSIIRLEYNKILFMDVDAETIASFTSDLNSAFPGGSFAINVPRSAAAAAAAGSAAGHSAAGRGGPGGRGGRGGRGELGRGGRGREQGRGGRGRDDAGSSSSGCYTCGSPDHWSDKCPDRKARSNNSVPTILNGASHKAGVNAVFAHAEKEIEEIPLIRNGDATFAIASVAFTFDTLLEPMAEEPPVLCPLPGIMDGNRALVLRAETGLSGLVRKLSKVDDSGRVALDILADSGASMSIAPSSLLHDTKPIDAQIEWGNGHVEKVTSQGVLILDVNSGAGTKRLKISMWGSSTCGTPLLSCSAITAQGICTTFSKAGNTLDMTAAGGPLLKLTKRAMFHAKIIVPRAPQAFAAARAAQPVTADSNARLAASSGAGPSVPQSMGN